MVLALGGAARLVMDDVEDVYLTNGGAEVPITDENGMQTGGTTIYSPIEVVFRVLEKKFPEQEEATMF